MRLSPQERIKRTKVSIHADHFNCIDILSHFWLLLRVKYNLVILISTYCPQYTFLGVFEPCICIRMIVNCYGTVNVVSSVTPIPSPHCGWKHFNQPSSLLLSLPPAWYPLRPPRPQNLPPLPTWPHQSSTTRHLLMSSISITLSHYRLPPCHWFTSLSLPLSQIC